LLRQVSARASETAGILSYLITDHYRQNGQAPRALRERLQAGPSAVMRRILDRAVERGEISPAVLGTRIASLPVDLIRHDLIMTQEPVPDATLTAIVDTIFLPLALSSAQELPSGTAAGFPWSGGTGCATGLATPLPD
jgi:hypothetical protein